VRAGADPRTQLELALVKAAAPQADGSTRALLARIERLEQGLSAASGQAILREPPAPAGETVTREPPAPAGETTTREPPVPAGEPAARESVTAGVEDSASRELPAVEQGTATHESLAPADVLVSPEPPSPEPAPPSASEPASDRSPPPVVGQGSDQPSPPVIELAPAVPSLVHDLDALWPAVLESVRAENKLLRAFFSEAAPVSITQEELTVAFPASASFNKRKAEEPANRAILIETLRRLTGRGYRVSFELGEEDLSPDGSDGPAPTEEEIVARLMSELDAEELPEEWLAQQKGGD
jgi:DNA polymerase-3 subunit gamma/tau